MGDRKIYCTNCGSPVDSEWKYCRNCGHPVCAENGSEQKSTGNYSPAPYAIEQPVKNTSKKRSGSGAGIAVFFVFLVLVVGAMIYASSNNQASSPTSRSTPKPTKTTASSTTPKPANTPKPTSSLKPVSVYNGKKFRSPDYEGQCPFTVSTPSGTGGYYVYLKYLRDATNSTEKRIQKSSYTLPLESDVVFYVSAGNKVEIEVPVGVYKFYYAYGETWYGEKQYFGEKTVFCKSDDLLTFYADDQYYNGHTIELWKQTNGNFDTDVITESQFPS